MLRSTDLEEYLMFFENTQTKKERDKGQWATHLLPLLNDRFRTVVMNMEEADRDNYEEVKAKLLEADDGNVKNAAQSFWTLPKTKGMLVREYSHKLYRLLKLFASDPKPEKVLQKILKERLIHALPREARTFVRNKDPPTVSATCQVAEQYYTNKDQDLTYIECRPVEEFSGSNHRKDYHNSRRHSGGGSKQPSSYQERHDSSQPQNQPKQQQQHAQSHRKKGWNKSYDKRQERAENQEKGEKFTQTCTHCGGSGHLDKDCPNKVNKVSDLGADRRLKYRQGTVNGKPVQDILLDNGAIFSIIARNVLDKDAVAHGAVQIKGVGSNLRKYQTTIIDVSVGPYSAPVRVAIADRPTIGMSLLLGHNIPDMNLEDLIAETRQSSQTDQVIMESKADDDCPEGPKQLEDSEDSDSGEDFPSSIHT